MSRPMNGWEQPLSEWAVHMKAAGAPKTTSDLRLFHMMRFAREVNASPADTSLADIEAWFADKNWSPNTRRSHRASLRAFYAWAVRTGLVESSPAHLLPPVRIPRPQPRPTPEHVYRAALAAAEPRIARAIRLAAQCGLRRSEIARVSAEDVERGPTGWVLRVLGKGGHIRMVPLPEDLADELRAGSGWIFPNGRGDHLTPAHLGKLVASYLSEGATTHTLRHRAATIAYASTHDLRAVQELLGHAKPETTAIYTLVPDDSIRAAMLAAAA